MKNSISQYIETLPNGTWHKPPTERFKQFVEDNSQTSRMIKLLLAYIRKKSGSKDDLNVFRILSKLGNTFPRYMLFLDNILMKGRISREDKERIILRTAWRLGCTYEWGHHVKFAKELGISKAQILSIAEETSPTWDKHLETLMLATDELILQQSISDATWQRLCQQYNSDQCVEFCMLVGHYFMVAVTINATWIQLETEYIKS